MEIACGISFAPLREVRPAHYWAECPEIYARSIMFIKNSCTELKKIRRSLVEEEDGRTDRRIPHIELCVLLRNERLKICICYIVETTHVRPCN